MNLTKITTVHNQKTLTDQKCSCKTSDSDKSNVLVGHSFKAQTSKSHFSSRKILSLSFNCNLTSSFVFLSLNFTKFYNNRNVRNTYFSFRAVEMIRSDFGSQRNVKPYYE